MSIDEIVYVTDLTDNEVKYVISENEDYKNRLGYIKNLINSHRNIFENSVNSYISSYDNTPIS